MSQRSPSQVCHHADFLRQCAADLDAEINAHPPEESTKEFLITIKSFMIALNGSFSQHHDPITFVEADLHHIWHMVLEVAKITGLEDTTHDSLILLLLYFKELGTLGGNIEGVDEEAVIADGGRAWTDLPYFGADLLAAWKESAGMTAKHRINLAAFTGKCVAHGVGGTDTVLSALWLLEEAFRGDGELAASEIAVDLVELLPVCTALLQNCCHKLLKLCNSSDQGPAGEFSMGRWLSWRRQFQVLSQSEDRALAQEAKCGFDSMINCGREMGYIVEGEERYWAKVMGLLADVLKRSGKESVGLEDIVADPSWAD